MLVNLCMNFKVKPLKTNHAKLAFLHLQFQTLLQNGIPFLYIQRKDKHDGSGQILGMYAHWIARYACLNYDFAYAIGAKI